jgi:S-DNA-T family DNA segregation ATPase FtsK/SpoIIIE
MALDEAQAINGAAHHLFPHPDAAPAPVDLDPRQTSAPLPWTRETKRHPIIPAWVLDHAQRSAAVRWAARWTGHATAFHLLRLPKYSLRAVYYAPRGVSRAFVRWVRWVFDRDAHALRVELIERRDAAAYHTAAKHRDERVKNRAVGSALVTAVTGVGGFIAFEAFPPVALAAGAVGAAALVWHGRPIDAPFLFDRTVTPTHVARLTSDVVARALAALGIGEIRKAVERKELAFTAPIMRDGDGWRAELDLPHGIAAVDVIEKRVALSSGLRRPLGCVWPEPVDEEHSGHLVLWVGDRPLSKQPARPYPLLESGETSLFNPLPFGVDQRGRAQDVGLMFASMACGAQPRMGKTFAVRLLALGAALDVTCELHLFDGKGMGDYVMFEPVAHTFLSGSRTDTLIALREGLAAVKEEVERRAELLTKLTRAGRCREGKVTPELARDKSLKLHPIVCLLDECHLAFDTGSGAAKALGEEITELAEYIVRVGPAAGVSLIASTQCPDAKSLPSGIRANVQLRYCLRVADQPTNDMVLGTSAYRNGVRATEFAMSDKGVGYLSGEGAAPGIVRTYYVDADQAAVIVARARQLREDAGTVSGMAAGIAPARRAVVGELLTDVLDAMGAEDQMWSEAICTRLAEVNPGRYAGWDATALGKALKANGVTTRQIWWAPASGTPGNRNGVKRQQIADALGKIRKSGS